MKPLLRNKLLLLLFVFAAACGKKQVSINEYTELVSSDEKLVQKLDEDKFSYECRFLPAELLAIRDFDSRLSRKEQISKSEFYNKVKMFQEGLYFKVSFTPKGQEYSRALSNEALQYEIEGRLKDRIYILTENSDTTRALNFQFINSYGMSPSYSYLAVFPRKSIKSNHFKLVVDNLFFQQENAYNFNYKVDDITESSLEIKDFK